MRTSRRLTALLAALLSLGLVATPAAAATGQPSSGTSPVVAAERTALELAAEAYMIQAHNLQRAAGSTRQGVTYTDVSAQAPLAPWTDISTVARRWSDQMTFGNFAHNPSYGDQYGHWRAASENIAMRTIHPSAEGLPTEAQVLAGAEQLMQAWWRSEAHRRNWMSPRWEHFSVGVAIGREVVDFGASGTAEYWTIRATANFRDPSGAVGSPWYAFAADGSLPPNEAAAGRRFDDVPQDHTFHQAIEALAASGITKGCGGANFCPDAPVTRGQMAAFLDRALGLEAASTPFSDSRGHLFEGNIGALAAAGITRGCNPPANTRFCPDAPVTRGQMAAFLVRALDLPASASSFADTRGHTFEGAVAALAAAGITKGCNPPANTRFCPDAPVTRAQMAAFLARADLAG